MPLFSIQIKNPYTMLIFVSILILVLYFIVAMVYAMKIDNALYYEYPKMSNKEIKKNCNLCFLLVPSSSLNWIK